MFRKSAENFVIALLAISLILFIPDTIYKFENSTNIKNNSIEKSKINTNNKNVYLIIIEVDENRIYLLKNRTPYKGYSCASGKDSTPSPLGYYSIIKKSLWGDGFGGYYMGLDCPWGDYGIHGTTSPESVGSSGSHGCFRMYNQDVAELYSIVPIGTRVYITAGTYGAFTDGFRTIGPNMSGLDVQTIQKRLKDLGSFNGKCDGLYDTDGFKKAVHDFQKANGLPVSDYITTGMYAAMGFVLIE